MRLGCAVHTWFIYRRSPRSARKEKPRSGPPPPPKHRFYFANAGGNQRFRAFKWMFGKSRKVVQNYFHIKICFLKIPPQSDSGKTRSNHLVLIARRFLDACILHVCWCWVDGWGRMQIFNVVTGADWMFYGRSLSWQRATACKSNWKEGNEGAGTPLYQGLGCKNRIWHRITRRAEFISGRRNRHHFRWKYTIFLIWHHDL